MLEKLLILCADSEFAHELSQAVENLENRKGESPDIEELKCIINNTIKLCQQIL
tara:strand:+ start:1889 stop:2050 length:162 start_codon:yes stop_codon:yes gene_type:complete